MFIWSVLPRNFRCTQAALNWSVVTEFKLCFGSPTLSGLPSWEAFLKRCMVLLAAGRGPLDDAAENLTILAPVTKLMVTVLAYFETWQQASTSRANFQDTLQTIAFLHITRLHYVSYISGVFVFSGVVPNRLSSTRKARTLNTLDRPCIWCSGCRILRALQQASALTC